MCTPLTQCSGCPLPLSANFFLAATEETKGLRRMPGSWHSWGPLVPNEGSAKEGGLGSCEEGH